MTKPTPPPGEQQGFPPRLTMGDGTRFISVAEHEALAIAMRDQAIEHLWQELNYEKPTLHFCRDWDFMLIDKTHDEFEACGCGPFPLKFKAASTEGEKP